MESERECSWLLYIRTRSWLVMLRNHVIRQRWYLYESTCDGEDVCYSKLERGFIFIFYTIYSAFYRAVVLKGYWASVLTFFKKLQCSKPSAPLRTLSLDIWWAINTVDDKSFTVLPYIFFFINFFSYSDIFFSTLRFIPLPCVPFFFPWSINNIFVNKITFEVSYL